jgi:hypothetical protein
VSDARCRIRQANADDAEAVADLAAGLAQSFPFSRTRFGLTEESAVYLRKVLDVSAETPVTEWRRREP